MRRAPVYDLIKTLSTAEVKMMTKRCESADAAYVSLLRIMHGSAKKDEALFKKEFAAIHPQVDYTETKSYLYKFLLRHLTEREHEHNVFTEVNYAFVTAELLLNRGLKQEAYTIFKSAKTKADEAGFYQLSIVALKRMQNICFSTSRTDKDYALIHQLGLEEADAREKDKAASISLQLYIRFLHLIEKHGGPTTPTVLEAFQKIVKHPVVQQRDKLTSKQARLITFDLLTNYYRLTNQYKQLVAISKKELVHYTPALLKDPYYAYRYIFMLHNLIGTLPHSAERKKYYTLLERAPTPNETTLHYKRLFLLHKAQGEAARMSEQDFSKLYAQTDAELKHSWLQQKPKERMNLLFNFLQIVLSRKDYDSASSLLIAELNNKELEKMLPQQYIGLRLFYLVTLYEQKKFHLMESPLRALHYAVQREDKQNKVAQELARLFSLLVKQAPALKLKQAIQKVEAGVKSTPYFSNQMSGINRLIDSTWYVNLSKRYR